MSEESEADGEAIMPAQIAAELDVLKFVNLALMQNGLPVAQDLRVENPTNELLKDVVCSFSSDDGLIVPTAVSFKEILPKSSIGKTNVSLWYQSVLSGLLWQRA